VGTFKFGIPHSSDGVERNIAKHYGNCCHGCQFPLAPVFWAVSSSPSDTVKLCSLFRRGEGYVIRQSYVKGRRDNGRNKERKDIVSVH
jgi:hypothetical protein